MFRTPRGIFTSVRDFFENAKKVSRGDIEAAIYPELERGTVFPNFYYFFFLSVFCSPHVEFNDDVYSFGNPALRSVLRAMERPCRLVSFLLWVIERAIAARMFIVRCTRGRGNRCELIPSGSRFVRRLADELNLRLDRSRDFNRELVPVFGIGRIYRLKNRTIGKNSGRRQKS